MRSGDQLDQPGDDQSAPGLAAWGGMGTVPPAGTGRAGAARKTEGNSLWLKSVGNLSWSFLCFAHNPWHCLPGTPEWGAQPSRLRHAGPQGASHSQGWRWAQRLLGSRGKSLEKTQATKISFLPYRLKTRSSLRSPDTRARHWGLLGTGWEWREDRRWWGRAERPLECAPTSPHRPGTGTSIRTGLRRWG